MKKHLHPLTPAALYARVSSDRQDVDLSVAAHLTETRTNQSECPAPARWSGALHKLGDASVSARCLQADGPRVSQFFGVD